MEAKEVKDTKIEVVMPGDRTVRIMRHMLEDVEMLGAVRFKKTIKEPPEELKKNPPSPPAMDVTGAEMKITAIPGTVPETAQEKEVRERKKLAELRALKNPKPQEKAAITRLSKKYETDKK